MTSHWVLSLIICARCSEILRSVRLIILASTDAHLMSTTGRAYFFFSYEGDDVGKFLILSSLNAKSLSTTQPRVQTFNQKEYTGVVWFSPSLAQHSQNDRKGRYILLIYTAGDVARRGSGIVGPSQKND
ncbi:hypothetical protein LY76DRAFT_153109 [Colletotrichum caudatum]|nr:hypothetical protein LY76DRAFT_153109 [Colletotrichum caudatum]